MGYNKALGLKLDGMTGRKRVEQNVEDRNYLYDGLYVMLKFGFFCDQSHWDFKAYTESKPPTM